MERLDAYLNDFATRCFRDVADQDYILARMAYRSELFSQFLWCGLQAMEKYFKAILLYNRVPKPKKNIGHSLSKAMDVAANLPFSLQLSGESLEIIQHLDTYGQSRYLDVSYFVRDHELLKLDKAVWETRLYCRVLNLSMPGPGGAMDLMPGFLRSIEEARIDPSIKFSIPGGVLEKILAHKDHPARSGLVWKNMFFNEHRRKTVRWRPRFHATNAPLSLKPELLSEVEKYVWLPPKVAGAYRDFAVARRT